MADSKSELDRAAAFLERLTGMPGPEDYAIGTATVVEVNEAKGWGFLDCRPVVDLAADGLEPTRVTLEYALRKRDWPVVGRTYAAKVLKEDPRQTEVRWA